MKKRLFTPIILLIILTLGLTGCAPGELAELEIIPHRVLLEPGQTQDLTVVGFDQFGTTLKNELVDVTWKVEGNVGTLSNDNGETVTFIAGKNFSEGMIFVSSGEFSASITVNIVDEIPEPLVWHDSFEDGISGKSPSNWQVTELAYHDANQTGFRITEDKTAPNGKFIAKYLNKSRADGVPASKMEFDIPEIKKGRLEFSVYQPKGEASNFGIKPFSNDDRLVDFWLSGSGALRLPEKDGEQTEIGNWITFAWEWDNNILHVYQLVDGKWIQKSPTYGYSIKSVPNKISIDGNTVEGRNSWGAVDNFKLYDLSLIF